MNYKVNLPKAADRYVNDGYTVTIRPSESNLPSFLAGYRPDFIARKGDETAVVTVTSRDDLMERMDAQFLMTTLYTEGILSHSDYNRLRSWARVRNTLAHGLRGVRVDHRFPSAIRDWVERILKSEASAAA